MLDTETASAGPPSALTPAVSASAPRVLLVTEEASAANTLAHGIALSGHTLVSLAGFSEAAQAAGSFSTADAVVLVAPTNNDQVAALCLQLQAARPLPVILLTETPDSNMLANAPALGLVACLPKTAAAAEVSRAVVVGCTWFQANARLQQERNDLQERNRQLAQTLENRKLIERAKGIYMRVMGLQEAEAHRRLQQESQRRRLGIADLAQKIIESDELLNQK